MITTDICIIGAGPVGLFAVFEAGLLKMRCHLVDALPQIGGQLTEIYPKKPIYDIPGLPEVKAQDLITNLQKQIEPFKPTFTLGERVNEISKTSKNEFNLKTSDGTEITAKVIVIAAGLGSFEPRKPVIENLQTFENKGIDYMIKNPDKYKGKRVIIAGGGDSALDWTLYLSDIVKELTLVHRNSTFRGTPDSAEKVFELSEKGKVNLLLSSNISTIKGNGVLQSVEIINAEKLSHEIQADYLIPLFGLSPKLGPIAEWGLQIDQNAIIVDTIDYSTNVPGIYAIGDINTYPGKLKLILSGFHEAALMAQSAFKYIYPDQKLSFKYTTVNGVNAF